MATLFSHSYASGKIRLGLGNGVASPEPGPRLGIALASLGNSRQLGFGRRLGRRRRGDGDR